MIDVLPRREEMARPECIRMTAVIARAHAGAEKRRALHHRHVPSAHELKLMGRRATRKSAADDQRFLHFTRSPSDQARSKRRGGGKKAAHESKPPTESSDFYVGAARRKPS